jgi:hypothetical protein
LPGGYLDASVIATATPGEYDLVAFVNSLDSPPLLVGHSQGGLVA